MENCDGVHSLLHARHVGSLMNDSASLFTTAIPPAATAHVGDVADVQSLRTGSSTSAAMSAVNAMATSVDHVRTGEVDAGSGHVDQSEIANEAAKLTTAMRSPTKVRTRKSVRQSEGLRREPRQARGHKRIDRLLDAADALFAKVGFDAVSTNAIARKARTSIGSLYQFFPNKEALLHALAERYLKELRTLHASVFVVENAGLPIEDLLWLVVRSLADFHQQHPGFQPLFHGSSTSRHLAAAERSLSSECYAQVEAMLAHRLPRLTTERRRLIAMINVEVTKALMPMSETGDMAHRELVLNEIHAMLLARNRQLIDEAGPIETATPVAEMSLATDATEESRIDKAN